jgi:adenosylcobinamide kinase / adenosylcobinamide-phosphate guanylyltransferase
MRVTMAGTGGAAGWPEPGCRCASCRGAALRGPGRRPSAVLVDDVLRLDLSGPASGGPASGGLPAGGLPAGGLEPGGPEAGGLDAGGYAVREVSGGWDVTAPDGERLLCAAGTGAVPEPPPGAASYDYAVLDLLGNPAQLGLLRKQGLVTAQTAISLACADHRAGSERDVEDRCGFWGARAARDGERVTAGRSEEKRGRVLVVGGARSGKSARAELRVAAEPDVCYVATGPGAPGDAEWAARLAAHRARRPAWWRTVETTDLAGVLGGREGTGAVAVLIDGIGTWLAAVMDECGIWDGEPGAQERLADQTAGLVRAWRETRYHVIAVSDETGLGLVPETPGGRLFRDELGRLNQALAAESEMTEFVLAGRVLPLSLW